MVPFLLPAPPERTPRGPQQNPVAAPGSHVQRGSLAAEGNRLADGASRTHAPTGSGPSARNWSLLTENLSWRQIKVPFHLEDGKQEGRETSRGRFGEHIWGNSAHPFPSSTKPLIKCRRSDSLIVSWSFQGKEKPNSDFSFVSRKCELS